MTRSRLSAKELTDEQVLEEFVRRFQCDGAVLIYLDSDIEFGFGRWCNSKGRQWVKELFKRFKQPVQVLNTYHEMNGGMTVALSA